MAKRGIKCVNGNSSVFYRYTVVRVGVDTTRNPPPPTTSDGDWPDYLVDTSYDGGICTVNSQPYSRYGIVTAFKTKDEAIKFAKNEQQRCALNERMMVQKVTHIVKPRKRNNTGDVVLLGATSSKRYKYMVSVLSAEYQKNAVKETRKEFKTDNNNDDDDEDDEEEDSNSVTYYAAKNKADGPFLAETEQEAKMMANSYAKDGRYTDKLVVYSRIADIETGEEDEVRAV